MALRVALVLDGNAQGARSALQQTTSDVDKLTAATVQQTAAAQANVAANTRALQSNGSVANIAAQFQDIAVTSAMGMSPLQIALQQGTQLSAVLGQQGAAGAAKMLAAALGSVLNPVSLITIGIVGFGAAALQALGSMVSGTDKATQSLEEHDKWLKEILTGYDSAAKAAKAASEASQRMPKGAVQSNLEKDLKDNLEKLDQAYQVVIARRAEFADFAASMAQSPEGFGVGPEVISQFTALSDLLNQVTAAERLTRDEAGQLTTAFTQLKNVNADENLQGIAKAALDSVGPFVQLQGVVDSLNASLATMFFQPAVAQFNRAMESTSAGIEKLKSLAPDLRDGYAKARDVLTEKMKTAQTPLMRFALQDQYDKTVAALDAQKAQQEARKAASTAKTVSDFEREIAASRERTAAAQTEIQMLGLGAMASERARKVLELETAAKKDAIGLSPARIAAIQAEADASAQATTVLERQKSAWDLVKDTGSSSIDTLVTSVLSGTASMGDAVRGFIKELANMALQLAVLNPIKNALFGTNLGTVSDLGGTLSTLFGGRREAGGPVIAGQAYLVGERRPEIFVPSSSGTILPNTNMLNTGAGGAGRTVVNVVAAPGQSATQATRREGDTDIVEVIMGEIDQRLSDGRAGRGFASRYGLNPRTVRS